MQADSLHIIHLSSFLEHLKKFEIVFVTKREDQSKITDENLGNYKTNLIFRMLNKYKL